jgi:DNA-binding NarL/FixJ family response regulator
MAVVTQEPRGLVRRIIAAAADQLAQHPAIPAEAREAFRATAISVIEHQITAMLGCDSVPLAGWTIVPSERQARRERIVEALQRGESPRAIASRELVTVRTVQRLAQP